MKSSEKMTMDLERAFVFCGPAPPLTINADSTITCEIGVGNYGRSAAVLREFYIEFSEFEPEGTVAIYAQDGEKKSLDMGIQPSAQVLTVFLGSVQSKKPNTPFALGYIKYLDIFQREHTNRFCVRIDRGFPGGTLPIAGSAIYNSSF